VSYALLSTGQHLQLTARLLTRQRNHRRVRGDSGEWSSVEEDAGVGTDSTTLLQLLILVSVSVPILKSIWFLKADIGGVEITFGAWGYCTASNCTSASLGYSLGESSKPAGRPQRCAGVD
jgi:hypothetical protein